MLAITIATRPSLFIGLAWAAAISILVLLVNRKTLRVLETYPELARLPFLRRLLQTG